jgi:hypothetical protein
MLLHLVVLNFLFLLTITAANDIFSLSAEDVNGNLVSLAKYSSAKAILVGII